MHTYISRIGEAVSQAAESLEKGDGQQALQLIKEAGELLEEIGGNQARFQAIMFRELLVAAESGDQNSRCELVGALNQLTLRVALSAGDDSASVCLGVGEAANVNLADRQVVVLVEVLEPQPLSLATEA